jgi:hypothetical protein
MVNFFHVQPFYSDHLTPTVSQSFGLATNFGKKMQGGAGTWAKHRASLPPLLAGLGGLAVKSEGSGE